MAKEPKNSFSVVLGELSNGHCVNELSENLENLIEQVRNRNGVAELTLKIKLKARNGGKQIDVEHTITTKEPKRVAPSTLFYTTEANALQRNDPDQRTFDLRELPEEPVVPLRSAAS